MFEKRPNSKEIEFMYFGTSGKMPSGETLKNGDSVQLKYKQYEIEVVNITAISGETFSGTVDSISNIESRKEIHEIGSPINIRLGEKIEFSKENIFHYTRES